MTLTPRELLAMDQSAELYKTLVQVVDDGGGAAGPGDTAEITAHIHALQALIMSNSAARAHPDRFRVLGANSPGPAR